MAQARAVAAGLGAGAGVSCTPCSRWLPRSAAVHRRWRWRVFGAGVRRWPRASSCARNTVTWCAPSRAAARRHELRTVIIISYWFAPSPAVGGKRFSFLAREFARLGYDVHVITHESREWIDWQTDASLPLAGTVHRCAERIETAAAGPKPAASRRECPAAPAAGADRLGISSGRAPRTRRRWPSQRLAALPQRAWSSPPRRPHAARDRRRPTSRAASDWPLILDYRDPWSAHVWPQLAARRRSRSGSRDASSARLLRRSAARVLNTPAMRASVREVLPARRAARGTS